jgi:hypothetical protein
MMHDLRFIRSKAKQSKIKNKARTRYKNISASPPEKPYNLKSLPPPPPFLVFFTYIIAI